MLKPILAGAALSLSVSAFAQTAAPEPAAPAPAPASDDRAAILDDSATTPRAGETDVGATRSPDYRPVGMGGATTAISYPPCTRTRTDHCRQRGGR